MHGSAQGAWQGRGSRVYLSLMSVWKNVSISYLKPQIGWMERFHLFFASVGGAGDSPWAPGTVGSMVAVALFYPLQATPSWVQGIAIAMVTLLGVWNAFGVSRWSKIEDDSRIVIDEVAGMWITLFAIPFDPWTWALGFLLFRALDIAKVYPANYCDEKMHGGWGVMLDDVVSGIYAQVLLRAVMHGMHAT